MGLLLRFTPRRQEAPGGNRGIACELMRRQRLVLSARFRSRLAGYCQYVKAQVETVGSRVS